MKKKKQNGITRAGAEAICEETWHNFYTEWLKPSAEEEDITPYAFMKKYHIRRQSIKETIAILDSIIECERSYSGLKEGSLVLALCNARLILQCLEKEAYEFSSTNK